MPNPERPAETNDAVLGEILGYLNFSGGRPDTGFQANVNRLYATFGDRFPAWTELRDLLLDALHGLRQSSSAFADSAQAEGVVRTTCDAALPAYREFHADLLAHLPDEDFQHPLFVARVFEAVLSAGGPWDETERIVSAVLAQLNDFVGYRPLAVLENERLAEPYPHERFRPVPLYLRGVGSGAGPYTELIDRTIVFLEETPDEVLARSYFALDRMDELALDVRAHDHTHPVNKRTNYMFGEWDPHLIDNGGYYRRFVLRKVILDALLDWLNTETDTPYEERLHDAAAVLCGTMLMASSVSGAGPDTHDSSVSLTSLLPMVARQRDAFYQRLLAEASGPRAERLRREAESTQQPFGHVRQKLNMVLAGYGAKQVQCRHIAWLYARLAFPEAARQQAERIPSVSGRFETEVQWRITSSRLQLARGEFPESVRLIDEARDQLRRGIECGAFVDPWNILAFQGQFPLFVNREDAVPDQRAETLLHLMDGLFGAYAAALGEAAARGETDVRGRLDRDFASLAREWDGYATTVVEDLPRVVGGESLESARHVADALAAWRASGESSGDVSFWRQHVGRFESSKAYANVVDAVLRKRDHVAAMGLLVQWLSEADRVGLGENGDSLSARLVRWLDSLVEEARASSPAQDAWPSLRRYFDSLEANAGDLWSVPRLEELETDLGPAAAQEPDDWEEPVEGAFDEEDELYGAAWEDVVYRDSTADGNFGETLDDGPDTAPTEFERLARRLESRLRFLHTLTRMWQSSSSVIADMPPDAERTEHVQGWLRQVRSLGTALRQLMDAVQAYQVEEPSGELDSNIEYDMQVQTKFYLLHMLVATIVNCRMAEWCLQACLPRPSDRDTDEGERTLVALLRGVLLRDRAEVRRLLPRLQSSFAGKPLLYVPFDNGGEPRQVLSVRLRQGVIRLLLSEMPRMGLVRETWHLLRTAYRMERERRPSGVAVTEYDRLFRTALRSSLEQVVEASAEWRGGRATEDELAEVVGEVVEKYVEQWTKHSRTMRLSTVESLLSRGTWERVRSFVQRYGEELFQTRMLTLGNVRAILHLGVPSFLEYLQEEEDPLLPSRLLEDLRQGTIEEDEVEECLELVYGSVVDKFDRFLEYNTTTTQSDYGEAFYCLLDFLRVEAEYDREAWKQAPMRIAHQVLVHAGHHEAALVWERIFREKTEGTADRYARRLRRLEREHAMRLPSVTDRIEERFVKPLAVNRMTSLVPLAAQEAREGAETPHAFEALRQEIDAYLEDTTGSGIDIPPWLRKVEQAIDDLQDHGEPDFSTEPRLDLPSEPLPLRELRRQLNAWKNPLGKPRKRKE